MISLCRQCYHRAEGETPPKRCASCGSPRLIRHEELSGLSVAHIDCDAFYASIEKRDNPALRDVPVIVGGGKRGVVATACYIARAYGIHSAQPMFKALKLCPSAIVVPPNMTKYVEVSRAIKARMLDLTPTVETLSLDEAFLDLSGTVRLHRRTPAETLARFQSDIEREIGITISIGLSYCKFLAKVGSDLDKPRGFSVIGRKEAVDFLTPRPVSSIWGVGKSFTQALERDGLRTIGDIRAREIKWLIAQYGAIGQRLHDISNGRDSRRVDPAGERKSISSETTLENDLRAGADLQKVLWSQAERVAERAKANRVAGRTVVLKLKTSQFKTITRNRRLSEPTQLADTLFKAGRAMMEPLADGTPYRLVGIGISDLVDDAVADPGDLADPDAKERREAERAMDKVRAKFGRNSIIKGRSL